MSIKRYFGPDPDESRLRTTIEVLGREIDRLAPAGAQPSVIQDAYQALVLQLDLGPEPTVRRCAYCGTREASAVTACGNCWSPFLKERSLVGA